MRKVQARRRRRRRRPAGVGGGGEREGGGVYSEFQETVGDAEESALLEEASWLVIGMMN